VFASIAITSTELLDALAHDCQPARADGAEERDKRGLARRYQPSTKITALLAELDAVKKADPKNKSVVFSQWTSMLDLVQVR
jgi:hypothetical protein